MKNPCEDYGYEMQRQERIDAMNNEEWQDLPSMEDVARAKLEKWDIQECYCSSWHTWDGKMWRKDAGYQGRPARPKKRQVKLECYLTHNDTPVWIPSDFPNRNADYIRFPAGDIEGEVTQ